MIPFITSRTSTWRLLPPRLAGGITGSTCAHSSSVRSLGYRNLLRSSRPRFFAVHIGGAPLESGHHFESQAIQRIQNVFGRTLRFVFEYGPTPGIKLICHWKIDTLVETFIRRWCCRVGRNSFATCWQIVTTIRQHYSLYWLTILSSTT